ncbi:MAG TPA: HAMP domain-containing sensor histidine kinase [Candidatus Saccharimonadales bacterium]|nr:HAMP domain-containing sensor histidine kinase [Candidatus Saccharimonadales bacterium]
MFKSARVQLTLFYLAILVAFSLTLTISFRMLFEHEYRQSNAAERGEVRQLFIQGFPGYAYTSPKPYSSFNDLQDYQASLVRAHLNNELFAINMAALVIGGVLAYWFAGRTLKPIEEAHKAQARFATDASHELRTPLTNLKLENEIFLRQKHFSEDDARELINSNLEEVQRLEGLSSNLLALTQYGSTPLTLGPMSVQKLTAAAITHAYKAAESKRVQLIGQTAKASVIGHQESLGQLLGILLDNAVKYGPEKGTVTIGGRVDDGHYLLWVQDEGPGIAEHDLPRIFDRLYRGDKARSSKVSGYGLGLSLAKAIARANHAELRAENIPGGGASFIVRLPLAK